MERVKDFYFVNFHQPLFNYLLKWVFICSVIGILSGSASALFLYSLDVVTDYRETNVWIISLLPLAGFIVGLMYHYLGKEVEAGNNLLLEEIHTPKKITHLKMTPLVLIGTLLTHLFGGSAGREGTAVQMGGSMADQLSRFYKIDSEERIIIIICGISAGFASVFGTPLAGMVFGLEVYLIGKLRYNALFPGMLAAIIGNLICNAWNVHHTHYSIGTIPSLSGYNLFYCAIAGILFGLAAMFFARFTHWISSQFKKYISYPPLRPAVGGIIVALLIYISGTTKYIGLGIPTIVDSFNEPLFPFDFALKILFTSITLGAAFKGGEVTPLFFIGATLGNALALFIPLPVPLLAGLGFAAVFAGAANTPLCTILMAIELFGMEIGVYAAIACIMAYLFSGNKGIYGSQKTGEEKAFYLFPLNRTGKK